jgi:hypothetical protein
VPVVPVVMGPSPEVVMAATVPQAVPVVPVARAAPAGPLPIYARISRMRRHLGDLESRFW